MTEQWTWSTTGSGSTVTVSDFTGYHDYVQGVGEECLTCHCSRWNVQHFDGSQVAATEARLFYSETRRSLVDWRTRIVPGDRVQVVGDYYRAEWRGLIGRVVSMNPGNTVESIVMKVGNDHYQITTHYLQPPFVNLQVPDFSSVEEADEWLEDRARELGVQTEPDVPFFGSLQEARDWLERGGNVTGNNISAGNITYNASIAANAMAVETDRKIIGLLRDAISVDFKPIDSIQAHNDTAAIIRAAIKGMRQGPS